MRFTFPVVLMLLAGHAVAADHPRLELPRVEQLPAYHQAYLELDDQARLALATRHARRTYASPLIVGREDIPEEASYARILLQNSNSEAVAFLRNHEKHRDALDPGLSVAALDPRLSDRLEPFLFEAVPLAMAELIGQLETPHGPGADAELQRSIDELFSDRTTLKAALSYWKAALQSPEHSIEISYLNSKERDLLYPQYEGAEMAAVALTSTFHDNGMLLTDHLRDIHRQYRPRVPGFTLEFPLYTILHELAHLQLAAGDDSYAYDPYAPVETYDVYSSALLDREENSNADNYVVLLLRTLARLGERGVVDLTRF